MKNNYILSLFFSFFFSVLVAQNGRDSVVYTLADTAYAGKLYQEAKLFINQKKYEEALAKLDMSSKIYLAVEGEKSVAYGNILNGKAIIYRNKNKLDSAAIFYKKLINIRETLFKSSHPDVINIRYNLSKIYMSDSKLSESSNVMDQIISAFQKDPLSDSSAMLINVYRNYGILYGRLGDYQKALIKHQRDLDISEKRFGVNSEEYSHPLNNIGIVYRHLRQYDKALSYYFKSLNLKATLTKEQYSQNLAVTYGNIGGIYMETEDWDKALIYIKKAIENFEHINKTPDVETAFQYDNLGMGYQGKKNYNEALKNHLKAKEILEENNESNSVDASIIYYNIAETFLQLGKIDMATENIEKAYKILESLGELKGEHAELILNKLGQIKTKSGDINGALIVFKNALKAGGYDGYNGLSEIYSPIDLVESFRGLISTYLEQFKLSKNESKLDSTLNYIKEADFYFNKLQFIINNRDAKSTLVKYALPLIEICLSGHNVYGQINPNFISTLPFDLAEKSKSQLLFESFQEVNALKFGKIPSKLIDEEKELRLLIAFNEKKRQQMIESGSKETDINTLEVSSQLFDLKRSYETLKERFEKDYPDYYRLKYDLSTASLKYVQDTLLSKDQTLLEYFVGDSSIFIFTVNKDNYKVSEGKKDFALDSLVEAMRTGIYNTEYLKQPDSLLRFTTRYVDAAATLYDKLVAPVKTLLRGSVVVVPDGVLGYLPFDALLINKPNSLARPDKFNYLLNDHKISYCYSATILKDMVNKKHRKEPTQSFLAMAPYFKGDTATIKSDSTDYLRNGLDSLPYTGEEVTRLQRIMGGEAIVGKGATEDVFTKKASEARIIHLSTHGKMDDKVGDYSYLAFTEQADSIENEWLYTRELYNLSLNADMVVLSACETGIGKLQRGEGIISLARAFAYAGAKSIVTTLWQVKDESTKDIMVDFYKNLKRGKDKDEALQLAKLAYIKKHKNKLALPFFWSGIIPIGDMRAIGK